MTDQELQLALAKMLPEKMDASGDTLHWRGRSGSGGFVRPSEWLHVAWLVEQTLTTAEGYTFYETVRILIARDMNERKETIHGLPCHDMTFIRASWQQRAEALCKVKGIT